MSIRGDWRHGLPESLDRSELPDRVGAIQHDSRLVEPGDLFVCIRGDRSDGHNFATAAVRAGAVAIVAQSGMSSDLEDLGVPVLEVNDSRRALATIAAAHEGHPGRHLTVIGITGTNGKSTTAFLTLAALEACGVKTGVISTVGSRIDGREIPNQTRLTTPEAPTVQHLMAEMVDAECTHVVIEATSHALDLHRLVNCEFDVAVLTNVFPDHLDYHGSFDAYVKAKKALFAMLDEPTNKRGARVAIVNADDAQWENFAGATESQVVTYALDARVADVKADDVIAWPDGATFVLRTSEEALDASVRLTGRFNVANATAAITTVSALGLDPVAAASGVARWPGVPGRMERIDGAPFGVIVDYAHTADAMRQVLDTLRDLIEHRLIVVFGCAGERSFGRRSGLGTVVAELADYAILTEEDSRSESPDAIIDDIAKAMTVAGAIEGEQFERIPDRRSAIVRGLDLAQPGDLLLVAGKGHETTIERADESLVWDERALVRDLISDQFPGDAVQSDLA